MTQEDRPYLGDYFFLAPARANLKKPIFGEEYMILGPFIFGGLHVFTMSAVLGYAQPNKLDALMQLLSPMAFRPDADAASSPAAHFEWMVQQNLERVGREPTTLQDYWTNAHFGALAPENVSDPRIAHDLVNEKVKLSRIREDIHWFAGEGLAFGAKHPALFERLYHQQFEAQVDQSKRPLANIARWNGLVDIPAQQIPLREMVKDILAEMSEFVSQFFPELMNVLDLREPTFNSGPETPIARAPQYMGDIIRPFYERMLFLPTPEMFKMYPELPFLKEFCMTAFDSLLEHDASSITLSKDQMATAYENAIHEEVQAAGIELFGSAWGQRFRHQDDLIREATETNRYLRETHHSDFWDNGAEYNQAVANAVFADAGNEVDAAEQNRGEMCVELVSQGVPPELALRISNRIGIDRELSEEAKTRLAKVFLERTSVPLDFAPAELQQAITNLTGSMMAKLYATAVEVLEQLDIPSK